MSLYEAICILIAKLKMIQDTLSLIWSISAQNERHFPMPGIFINQKRSGLSDLVINTMCFKKPLKIINIKNLKNDDSY